jgi:tRNA dimethylallyltransferase
MMRGVFYIVGPTASGKSEIAVEVARKCGAEIVSADAFQIYRGLNLLTARPDAKLLRAVRHHLIGAVDASVAMNAEEFRRLALAAIEDIQARGKQALVVGGSGMYVQALTDGLSPLPAANMPLRARLDQLSEGELFAWLEKLDLESARVVDARNKRRLIRAIEICLVSGRPASEQRRREPLGTPPSGVFLFRDRDDLHQRINARVEWMFAAGVVDEVRAMSERGPTAAATLGLREIRELLAGKISEAECIAAIQQATRRYAKRQLTWFRQKSTFESLNLSLHGFDEAIEWISHRARLSLVPQNV